MDENKKRALAAALGQIEKQFGKGAVMRMGDHDRQAIPAISTGSLGLDIALGIGGLGRLAEGVMALVGQRRQAEGTEQRQNKTCGHE